MSNEFKLSPLVAPADLEFAPWPKIGRGQLQKVTITEKMDGSNVCIIIADGIITGIQSRNRFITPGKQTDNFGFAGWVHTNAEVLVTLGDGHHFGEWAGLGIQSNPHNLPDKQLFLFNTLRFGDNNPPPSIVNVVPTLYAGELGADTIYDIMQQLLADETEKGNTPEGVIVSYHAQKRLEKHTYNYQRGKWAGR